MGSLLLFAIQDSIIITLSKRYALLEVLCLRSLIVLVMLVVFGLVWRGPGILYSQQPKPLMARGALAFLAFTSYYLALTKIPLADAAAVYMTAPLFVTLYSAPLLGEKVGPHRWGAVVLGFAAVMIMLNPGAGVFDFVAVIPLFSALCYALIPIINRRIGMSEHALTMAIYTTVTYLALILILALIIYVLPTPDSAGYIGKVLFEEWTLLSLQDVALIVLAAGLFAFGLLSITQGYRIAIVSTVAPFEYSYLLWATIIGFLLFGTVPGPRTLLGGAIVVTCGCYILYRERKRAVVAT